MTLSVQTNASALVALQNLNRTNVDLENVQTRINTGLKVSGAEENASVFAVAQGLRSDVGALEAVSISLDRAVSIGNVALAAGEAISDLLIEMRAKATAALDPSIDTFSRSAFNSDFRALLDQLRVVVTNAEFDGANLLNNSIASGIQFLADADASRTITLNSQNLTISGPIITIPNAQSLGTVTLASEAVSFVQASLENVNQALANLGSDLKKIEAHREFVTRLNDTLTVGIGNLVDADLARESARLQALQVKQQLGVQTLSIANSQPQIILGLFGG